MNEPAIPLPALIDTHCHLTWGTFAGDLDEVVARMLAAGVLDAVVVSTDVENARQVRNICRTRSCLHPAAGIHPNDLPEDLDRQLDELSGLLDERDEGDAGDYVAVGETGLDYFRDRVPPAVQRRAFLRHAQFAASRDLPLIVHIRDREGRNQAFEDVADVLSRQDGVRGVIHCYTGTAEQAERYLELGFLISFSGIVTFPRSEVVREAARSVPLDRLLVETDAPFLAPQPWRGKRNEPAYVTATAQALAELQGVGLDRLRRVTSENARSLFGLPEP